VRPARGGGPCLALCYRGVRALRRLHRPTHDLLEAGASEQEVLDALGVAILMGGGPSVMYATHVLEAMEDFKVS
jgi:alkylhydroperoxidase/carboxymuconolactone decarboxylase family protein YurZ